MLPTLSLFTRLYDFITGKSKELGPFDPRWRIILAEKVPFYNSLSATDRIAFELRMQAFLAEVRVTGIGVEVDDTDRVLIGASAIIPIFGFADWEYSNVYEILLYADRFNERFETEGDDRKILGMVGTGFMNGKMALSKPALHHGFANETDGRNTAIHEFIHLIDKTDTDIDGLPAVILERQYSLPWLDMIRLKMADIQEGESDIRPYGATNQQEFLSVVGEYFFERPDLLADRHPKLYDMLEGMFKQDMQSRKSEMKRVQFGRNDPCPCGSGKKFKKCCGAVHG